MSNATLERGSAVRGFARAARTVLVLGSLVACEDEQGTGAGEDAGSGAQATAWCEVKALLDAKCVDCHDGEGTAGAPMALDSYASTQSSAPLSQGKRVYEAIGERIHDSQRPMPPANDLSAQQLAVLDAWIAAGAPASEEQDCPTQPSSLAQDPEDVWPPPEGCDEIYTITAHGEAPDQPYVVAPGEETHPQIILDAPWGDEPVQAIAFHPRTDNKRVLHHWILYSNGAVSAFLTGWAPGDDARTPLPPDVGMEMPTGAGSLRLDMHYNSLTASAPEADRSGLDVCVVKGANLREHAAAVTMNLNALRFPLVPANAVRHEATGECRVTGSTPVHLLTASPHSHTYAVGHRFSVKKASGEEIVLLDRPFTFGEQKSYGLSPEVIVQEGDTITTTCVYSNPTNRSINFGENTDDEMCFNFATYWPKGALVCSLFGGGGLLGGLLGGGGR
ncbi:MAG TPA: hypothetical protein VFZ61_19760 [Polyangiales bacterium]